MCFMRSLGCGSIPRPSAMPSRMPVSSACWSARAVTASSTASVKRVQCVDQLAQPCVVVLVEGQLHPGQAELVVAGHLRGQGIGDLDAALHADVAEVLV